MITCFKVTNYCDNPGDFEKNEMMHTPPNYVSTNTLCLFHKRPFGGVIKCTLFSRNV